MRTETEAGAGVDRSSPAGPGVGFGLGRGAGGDSGTGARFPSDMNRRLGTLLFLAGIPVIALLVGVAWHIEYDFSLWDGVVVALLWAGVSAFVRTSAATATLRRSDGWITVRAGWFARPGQTRLDAQGEILLDMTEGRKGVQVWRVGMKRGDAYEEIAHNQGGQLAMRNLAEWICKASGLALLDGSDEPAIRLEASDLDLPFRERAQKYPLHDRSQEAALRVFGVDIDADAHRSTAFSWHCSNRWTRGAAVLLTAGLLALYVVPEDGEAFYGVHGWPGIVAILGGGVLLMALTRATRTRLVLGAGQVGHGEISLVRTILRVPLWRTSVPTPEVEDVRVVGGWVAVISDRKILRFRTFVSGEADHANARWLANEIRSYLMGRSGAQLQPSLPPSPSQESAEAMQSGR